MRRANDGNGIRLGSLGVPAEDRRDPSPCPSTQAPAGGTKKPERDAGCASRSGWEGMRNGLGPMARPALGGSPSLKSVNVVPPKLDSSRARSVPDTGHGRRSWPARRQPPGTAAPRMATGMPHLLEGLPDRIPHHEVDRLAHDCALARAAPGGQLSDLVDLIGPGREAGGRVRTGAIGKASILARAPLLPKQANAGPQRMGQSIPGPQRRGPDRLPAVATVLVRTVVGVADEPDRTITSGWSSGTPGGWYPTHRTRWRAPSTSTRAGSG